MVLLLLLLSACSARDDSDRSSEESATASNAAYVAGIDHLAIRVTDMQRSGEFYSKLFGPAVKKPPGAIVANPGSVPSPHYWARLGESYLAISLASPENGPPGFDHPCLVFGGIDAEAMALKLSSLNRRYERPATYSIATDFWVEDPAGHLIQIDANPEGYWDRLDALAGAVPAEELATIRQAPVFRTIRIGRVALSAADLEASADYYRRLLGGEAETPLGHAFRVGPSWLTLEPGGSESFFAIEISDFDRAEVAGRLRALGVEDVMERPDEDIVALRDPDGLLLWIHGRAKPPAGRHD